MINTCLIHEDGGLKTSVMSGGIFNVYDLLNWWSFGA